MSKKITSGIGAIVAIAGLGGLFGNGKKADEPSVETLTEPTPQVHTIEQEPAMDMSTINMDDDVMTPEEIAQGLQHALGKRLANSHFDEALSEKEAIKTPAFAQNALSDGFKESMSEADALEIFYPTERELHLIEEKIGKENLEQIIAVQKATSALNWTVEQTINEIYSHHKNPTAMEKIAFARDKLAQRAELLKATVSEKDSLELQYYSNMLTEKSQSIYNDLTSSTHDEYALSIRDANSSFDYIVEEQFPELANDVKVAQFTFQLEVADGLTPDRHEVDTLGVREEPMTKEEYLAMKL